MKTKLLKNASNILFMSLLLLTFFTLSYCSDSAKEKSRQSINDLKSYVKEHKDATDKYMDDKWEDLEKEYDKKKAEVDKNMKSMDEKMKASYQSTVDDWESFKKDYISRHEEKLNKEKAEIIKSSLMPAGINTDLSNISGQNIAMVYEHLYNVVDRNKDVYSKEEWINVNSHWKSLNDVKDKLDEAKAITNVDERKIAGIKVKYAAIKSLNKPFAESEKI